MEVYKARGVNFVTLCTHNIDSAMKVLVASGIITITSGVTPTYLNGNYFKLNKGDRQRVNAMAEDTCIVIRFLYISSDKLHKASKDELKNDRIKSKHNYPSTFSGVIHLLQHHNLRNTHHTHEFRRENVIIPTVVRHYPRIARRMVTR